MTRVDNGEWQPVAERANLAGLAESIERFFDHVKIEVDVLAVPEPRVRLYLDADEVCASSGPGRMLECSRGWSLDGPPYADWSAGQILRGLNYICDPDAGADGPDGDGIRGNDCGLGGLLALVGIPCPILGDGNATDCDPLGPVMARLDGLRRNLDSLVLTLTNVGVTWTAGPAGEPRLTLYVHFDVGIDLTSYDGIDLDSFLDLGLTWASGSADYRFGAGDRHCAALECYGEPCAPHVVFRGFLPIVGDPDPEDVTVSWTTANLTIGKAELHPGIGWNWDPTVAPWTPPPLAMYIHSRLPELEIQARDAFQDLFEAVFNTLWSLTSFLPQQPLPPLLQRFAFCDQGMEGTCLFECLRDGCDYPAVPPLLPERLSMPPAPMEGLRLVEAAAGASRGWWNAVADPLTWLNEYASDARFEFVGVQATPRWPSRWTAVAQIESDLDCDRWPDHEDGCPTWVGRFPTDLDGDTIGDACDLCQQVHRDDEVRVPRRSDDYAGQVPRILGTLDGDGDGIGDRCDLCPAMPKRLEQDRWDEEARIPSWGPTFTGEDRDLDGLGDDCDNCPDRPNRDQWNCNWRDELLRGSLADPPALGRVGLGDACDPYPCVDSCAAPHERPELRVGRDETTRGRPFLPAAEAAICPVGKHPDNDSAIGRIDTRVRGCYCSRGERILGRCERDVCPNNGTLGERVGGEPGWQDASYPGVPRAPVTGDILPTTYEYKRLYRDEDWLGLRGDRFGLTGYASYYAPAGRKTIQTWNWRDDVCGPWFEGCENYIQMWFKPLATAGTWFDGVRFPAYPPEQGNTYTDGLVWVDADGNPPPPGVADFREPPFGGGGGSAIGLTIPWLVDDRGRITRNTGALVDILRRQCFAMGGPCPWWPDRLFFDQMGSAVAGVAVSGWSTASGSVGWTLGSRLPPGVVFDLLDPSVAVTHDLNGDPYRYWMFGGIHAVTGEATDQMWGARLAMIDAGGAVVYNDGSGLAFPLRNAAPPDPATTFFELSPLPRTNVWPSPRAGAVLACAGTNVPATGPGTTIEQACNGLCPKLDVVLGLNDPPDGVTQPAGALLLVGGEGPAGLLDDIWRYEEVATWQPPLDVSPGARGPWPSGWRRTGVLPGVAGGLSAAGAVQVGRSLWLVGGRTDAGPSSDVYRVDLDTGRAMRVEAAGWPGGPARIAPAVTYDVARRRLVLFGGVDAANRGRVDLWAFDPLLGTWSQLAPECLGNGCPPATGREKLVLSEIDGRPTVIADRGTSVPASASWTLREGAWVAAGERSVGVAQIDCDGDTAIEARFGLRCSTGSGGFPDYGRLRCRDAGLGCRPPILPGRVVREYRMPGLRALAARGEELFVLRGREVDAYRVGGDGALTFGRSLRLSRAAHDIAVAGDTLVVADGRGVSLLRATDGARLGEIGLCGRVRRVFADGPRAYIVGLFQVMMVDISDPTAPVILQQLGLLPERDGGLRVYSAGDCGRVDALLDRLCDATGACGAFGRAAAAYDGGRLFLHLFGTLHVLALREDLGADVLAGVPVGFLTDLAVDGPFVYGNGPGRRTAVIGELADGSWISVGEHDVREWVSGVASVGPWVVRAEPGRIQVATRQ